MCSNVLTAVLLFDNKFASDESIEGKKTFKRKKDLILELTSSEESMLEHISKISQDLYNDRFQLRTRMF